MRFRFGSEGISFDVEVVVSQLGDFLGEIIR